MSAPGGSSSAERDDAEIPAPKSTDPPKATDELPHEWILPTPEVRWNERKEESSEEERKKALDEMAGIVKTYSDELVKRWNGEIDTLLVYAGLFSAVLTAFNVQSYTLLAPDPQDRLLDTLQQISAQLGSFSINPSFVNSTAPAVFQTPVPPPRAPRSAVWLNTLWFSSLIFSLSAASLGIMVKQWLNEYSAGLSGPSQQTARLRQRRLNSLTKWRVGWIVAILPILLQIALVLFFSGLLVLLWDLNDVVAGVASALIGILSTITASTILLPSFTSDCCYISPPALWLFAAMFPMRQVWYHARRMTSDGIDVLVHYTTWRAPIFTTALGRLSLWLWTNNTPSPLWRGWEIQYVSKNPSSLDSDIITNAYTTTLNPVHLDVASPSLSALFPEQVVRCSKGVHEETVRHWKKNMDDVYRTMPTHFWSDVWVALHIPLEADRDADWRAFRDDVMSYCWEGLNADQSPARLASYTANVCSIVYGTGQHLYLLRNLVNKLDVSHFTARMRQSVALVAQQAFSVVKTDRKLTVDKIRDMFCALDLLFICVTPDPQAALEGDAKATIQAIRTFARHVISVFFERFRILVGDTNGEADEEDIDSAWQIMNWFIDKIRERQYQDEEFLLKLVEGLASLYVQHKNVPKALALVCDLVSTWTPNVSGPTARIRRRATLVMAQQAFDAASPDRRPSAEEICTLYRAFDLLLTCAAPDPAAREGNTKTIHQGIFVLFERFRSFLGDTNDGANGSDIHMAWFYVNRVIDRLRGIQDQDDKILPKLVDELASLVGQDEMRVARLDKFFKYDNRDWFLDQKRVLDERRNTSHVSERPAATSLTLNTASMKVDHGSEQSIMANPASTDTNVSEASTPIATSTAVASSGRDNPTSALPSDATDMNSNESRPPASELDSPTAS